MAVLALLAGFTVIAQDQAKTQLYNPEADARADIKKAIVQAQKEHKYVMLQVGGNWCIWCTRFHYTVTHNDTLQALMDQHYVFVPVNYDKNNAQDALWAELGYPQRFGFPVFVILDQEGHRIHTQNSAYLEEGKGHSPAKIAEFLKHWSPDALAGRTVKR